MRVTAEKSGLEQKAMRSGPNVWGRPKLCPFHLCSGHSMYSKRKEGTVCTEDGASLCSAWQPNGQVLLKAAERGSGGGRRVSQRT